MGDQLQNFDWVALLANAELTSDSPAAKDQVAALTQLGFDDPQTAVQNLRQLHRLDATDSLAPLVCRAFVRGSLGSTDAPRTPIISDPDMALNNLERFVAAARDPGALAALFGRDRDALPILLQMFSTSQYLSDFLIRDPAAYDQLRVAEGVPLSRELMIEDLTAMTAGANDEATLMRLLREFKQRETARIMYADIIRSMRLETIVSQLSLLAEALLEVALHGAQRLLQPKYGTARDENGDAVELAVLALGKLGGAELNYSSDIDLILLYAVEGQTDGAQNGGRSISHQQYFGRLGQLFTRLLNEATDRGRCYRVDLRLRPDGSQGPVAITFDAARAYYETKGRTWERQAFIKARPVAGDRELGWSLLNELTPWIYRHFLSRADISGIKALKRRMERRAAEKGGTDHDVKTGRGGIRDIEFSIQFLQLLNGGDLHAIRTENTLDAIMRLEHAGCLTMQERLILAENYAFLRKIEHRLQIMFDLQTHTLPGQPEEVTKLAARMGYKQADPTERRTKFEADHAACTTRNRQILDHLLHNAFADDESVDPEVDLVLDPDPDDEQIAAVLSPHGFADIPAAYRNLSELAEESIPFLSARRCRHFLASIAPGLLKEIATTPDPDLTLLNLSQVSESLGGKGVLWELFSANPACMDLYVRLCAASPYMASLLVSNPGMVDELMDSLLVDHVSAGEEVARELADRVRAAEDIQPILSSYKTSIHLRAGVRDLLGKDDVTATTRSLSNIAEACLQQVAVHEYQRLVKKFGIPSRGASGLLRDDTSQVEPSGGVPLQPDTSEFVILALGKLGGREPNYHSDLDVIFLYECDGNTRPFVGDMQDETLEITSNQHFYSQLGQRIIRYLMEITPQGRMYEIDARLRPTGKSGSLALSLDEFSRYFSEGSGQLWERLALCKARPVFGSQWIRDDAMSRVHTILAEPPWQPDFAGQIREMRYRMESDDAEHNLKRGVGGTVDIEFTVQTLQLKHAVDRPEILVPGTVPAIASLAKANILSAEDAEHLDHAYRTLRRIESALRLMNTSARHDLPQTPEQSARLAYLLRDDGAGWLENCREMMARNREIFERIMGVA